MTARDLIAASLRLIGVLASGETPSANEAEDALTSLNDMINSWSTESLMIPSTVRETFPLTVGQQTYTMGVGGNFDTARPVRVEHALLQITSNNPPLEIPMKLLTEDQFSGIILKGIQSTYPLYLYIEETYPLDTLNFWPIPNQANNIVFYSWKQLTELATLSTQISLPPGYTKALRYCLAVELAPEYGRAIPDIVMENAMEAKAKLKRMNFEPQYLEVDDSLLAKPAVWNWMTGEPT